MEQKKLSRWRGYERLDFVLNGHEALIVFPKNESQETLGKKWVWRTEFFTAFDGADMMMLERGYCLLFYSIPDLYGCEKAVDLMKKFYDYVVNEFNLVKKTLLIGLSRGGLYACNFATKYPNIVSKMYLDAPVLDVTTWPKMFASREWEECKGHYGITDDTPSSFEGNPINNFDILIANALPIIVVAGDADQIVPYEFNALKLIDKYLSAKAPLEYIIKPNCDHHPHGLTDPTPICDYLCKP